MTRTLRYPTVFLVALIAAFSAPAAAFAAAPVLQSVSFNNSTHVLSVSWSLPPGVEARVLEANTNPATDSEGYFLYGPMDGVFGPNIIFESIGISDTTTSWVHGYPNLGSGTYYVHVAGFDSSCLTCSVRQWSSMATFTVGAPAPSPTPTPTPTPPAPTPVAPTTYTADVTVSAGGSVQSNPAGIDNCRGFCTHAFPAGAAVWFSATPESGYTFGGWGGPNTTCGTALVCGTDALKGRLSLTAFFTPVSTPSPSPPSTSPTAIAPVIAAPTTSAKPLAGRRIIITFEVSRSDTLQALKSGKMICDPSINGKVISHVESFVNGKARLAFTVPNTAKGKLLRVKVTIRIGSLSRTRIATFRIG